MNYKINRLLNKLGFWLIMKTHIMTATEVALREESRRLMNINCPKCGTKVYPAFFDIKKENEYY